MSVQSRVWTLVEGEFSSAPEDWSAIHEIFERHGVPGTVQSDSPPSMSGYAFEPSAAELESLTSTLKAAGAIQTRISEVPEEDWAESWKQFFKPRRIGKRFVVRPTWEEFPAEPGDIELVLDPGQAFGTGDHPTTRMCLELFESIDLHGRSVADVGCGTAILSIACQKLGAKSVIGSDIDPASLEPARENVALNGCNCELLAGKGFEPYPDDARFDVVVSNIISAALIALAPSAAQRVNSGGHWVVSGIIEPNWPDVRAAAEKSGFTYETHQQENEWIAAIFRR